MDDTFRCGLIRVAPSGETPNWQEFARRMAFAQRLGLNAVFLTAFQNEQGDWVVPFFSAEDSMGRDAKANEAIARVTPYELVGTRKIDVAKADLETLASLAALVPEPAREVRTSDVMPTMKHKAISNVDEAFDGLVGMAPQQELFSKLAVARSKHGNAAIDSFHFVFDGPPGSGKTELASRTPALLDLLGITDGSGRFVKVGEANLVAKYVGHTAPKVRRVVESALGGVLFIDEAYAIMSAPHFGQEAIDALVDQLETHRHDLVCIIAGYTKETDALLDSNPGLRDRFPFRITFPEYDDEELADIFEAMASSRGFSTENYDELVSCARILRQSKGFSNARTMRKLLDHSIIEAASSHDEATIYDKDLRAALNQVFDGKGRRTIGF
ncbi:MAG: AAA family ATPase [Coriobacteriales bacterium]|nr:AAA family ATPase [Coriobacteriales bacterium]